MASQKTSKVYRSKLVVQLRSVPYDMMRYDNCVPDTEADAHKLERVAGIANAKPEDHTVAFRRYAAAAGPPSVGRWLSFNCKVLMWEPIS